MKMLDFAKTNLAMRIPSNEEWDQLMDAAGEDNAVTHWKEMGSWVNDSQYKEGSSYRAHRGCTSVRHWDCYYASRQIADVGFRPVFEGLNPDSLTSGIQDGNAVVVGTLYMNGNPVRVPQKPTLYGDIADYIPGAKLEMREALDNPAYQVTAIKVGDVLIADRNLLKNISYEDIESSLVKRTPPTTDVSEFVLTREEDKPVGHWVRYDGYDGRYSVCITTSGASDYRYIQIFTYRDREDADAAKFTPELYIVEDDGTPVDIRLEMTHAARSYMSQDTDNWKLVQKEMDIGFRAAEEIKRRFF